MYFFSEQNIRGNHAGTKARNDVEHILREYGCKPINRRTYILKNGSNENQIYSNLSHRYQLWPYFHEVRKIKNEIIFVQYPMLAFDFEREYFEEIAKNNQLVLLVHDLHSLKRQNRSDFLQEISLLNLASAVIVHNRAMREVLQKNGLTLTHVYELQIFDYLYAEDALIDHSRDQGIAFAGNLEKSQFLREMADVNSNLNLHLYGQETDLFHRNTNVFYHGSFLPDELPGLLEGKFGLIWDGDSIDECSGDSGQYLRYNNPHKTSLYIAADMPVVIWERAAMAQYIKERNIGIAIPNLRSLKIRLNAVSESQYHAMQTNIHNEKLRLVHGKSLMHQLEIITNELGRK